MVGHLLLTLAMKRISMKQHPSFLGCIEKEVGLHKLSACAEGALHLFASELERQVATEQQPEFVWMMLELCTIAESGACVRKVFESGATTWLHQVLRPP